MKSIAKFLSGKITAPVTMLIALFFAVIAFGPLAAGEGGAAQPGVGLPANNETVLVDEALAKLPGQDGTAAVIVYATENGSKFTDEQLNYLRGTPVPFVCAVGTPPFVCAKLEADAQPSYINGVAEKFKEYSNVKVGDINFVPPATISEDGSAAVVTIPMVKYEATEEITKRVEELRSIMKDGTPSGLIVKLTGPEGFQADIAGVFAGANFTLLAVTAGVVILLLLVTYRSPSLWLVPLLVIGTADRMAQILAGQVATAFDITLDGSVTGILSVLVFGAGTDYALLLISRYREELLKFADRREAMATAWRESAGAILASGGTVVAALLTLSLADLAGTRALGLACAVGVVVAMISALFVLPAALVSFGRWIFWPGTPKLGGINKTDNGVWAKLGRGVSKRPRIVAIAGFVVLAALAVGSFGIKIGLSSTEQFMKKPEAVVGIELLAKSFPAGATSPTVVIANKDKAEEVVNAIKEVKGVDSVEIAKTFEGEALTDGNINKINVVLTGASRSEEAYKSIVDIRAAVKDVAGADAKVGGQDAQYLDVKNAYAHDQGLLIPIILALVFLVLVLLLRSIVAPVLLLLTVVASFFASLGAGWLVFVNVFNFPGLDLSVFLYSFLFLVALGVDYNIFLVTRAQEESGKLGLKQGMIKALSSTGGVITSAGILLAAVFAVLGVLPLIALTQIGVIVCIGVLLDTLLVRTVIVPALAFIAGEKFWWPRKPVK
jgi:putative drug exporter of the RND superfamily